MGGSAQVQSQSPARGMSRVNVGSLKMKYLTASALLAFSLAVVGTSASAADYRNDCYKCPPPRNYDSQEVLKQSRDVDHTRTIETSSVVPSRRLIELNHLIIRENETRHVGVVQHNHTIIEKELVLTKRNVDTKTVNTQVNLVEHKYNTERKRVVEEREVPGHNRDLTDCNCEGPRHGKPYPVQAYGMAPKYVSTRY